jgi:hypothetical protein
LHQVVDDFRVDVSQGSTNGVPLHNEVLYAFFAGKSVLLRQFLLIPGKPFVSLAAEQLSWCFIKTFYNSSRIDDAVLCSARIANMK